MAHATLLQAQELELTCMRSSDGQTTEARTPTGETVATSDGSGVIADPAGNILLRAEVSFPKGTSGRLDIADGAGRQLGSAASARSASGPRR